jgi:hypothetical protein
MTSPSPEESRSEHVSSTTLCCAEVDKDGRILRSFCVTMPGEYPRRAATPQAPETDSAKEATQGESPRPPATG